MAGRLCGVDEDKRIWGSGPSYRRDDSIYRLDDSRDVRPVCHDDQPRAGSDGLSDRFRTDPAQGIHVYERKLDTGASSSVF